ncbi:DUF4998 domain-containing protein [Mucilaginibacter gynuensis]
MKQYKITVCYLLALIMLVVGACTKIDDFKDKFAAGGPLTYPGKMDSVKIYSGKNRVLLKGLFTSDPKITKYKVYWSSKQDSVEIPVTRTNGVDTVKLIIPNLPEGNMTFEIRTYDKDGHISIPVTATGNVYSTLYQSSLVNRGVAKAEVQADGSALINWADVNANAGLISIQIRYNDAKNIAHDTIVKSRATEFTTSLPNFKVGNGFSYKTAFKPDSSAIDTFYVDFQSHTVKAEITSIYLSNASKPFQRNTFDGRWGTLAAPWITNAAAKNKGGVNGGYSSDEGGVINWETWGNTPVVNGIIYQPTSAPLPAGTYIVSFEAYSEVQNNSSVYCIAAAGGNGLPVLANLNTALGYVGMYNSINVGSTGPSTKETRSFTFTLAAPQVVSIGFLGNIVGNGNPGSYFQVFNIKLFQN